MRTNFKQSGSTVREAAEWIINRSDRDPAEIKRSERSVRPAIFADVRRTADGELCFEAAAWAIIKPHEEPSIVIELYKDDSAEPWDSIFFLTKKHAINEAGYGHGECPAGYSGLLSAWAKKIFEKIEA